ncbi:MAG: endonuclease III domain-containing protein [Candidatus Thiodiazotropha sp. (ex Lucinoma aequizonata)]|nr:endonuclease III domain-containing protein [Candidatus Thiodiazotropha sp. (ex Lucinoma aequizonata)]MCU7889938.1 endonuclease III domain-containing protein [Candidatus Thiodiazotropha sp. (ex Lucinoma aequizonata)]MCU7896469.1 endonuclease III domain-containing protein [Candidatus Thiodiazotropha sp. (ex Lucinoma aequizonata)]MCU7898617.1 endonuclease III domain-containing protein [Candidatus Thiodiazotropha sp. (ex Lucinoma aequizonata)]MCU7902418.1 endonuclease III domain-containing prote
MQVMAIFHQLYDRYGSQHWWPAETPFEVMVGAVLTQNAAWRNVEIAIANLKAVGRLELESILAMPIEALAQAIRPAGYFNIKAKRLQHLCQFLQQHPELDQLDSDQLRRQLLSVHGIGPETADDILLYAFNRPVFVIDAYTRRLFSRLGLVEADIGYESMREEFERVLGADPCLFNEYHALIVIHAKEICRPLPMCGTCPLVQLCSYAVTT